MYLFCANVFIKLYSPNIFLNMLQAKQIIKNYGELQVLKTVDLTINKGEILAITGASGAGKSTLLQIIGTLDKADSGQVLFNGLDTQKMKEKEIVQFRNKHLGFIFQFHHLLPEFTAIENISIPGWIAGTKDSAVKERAKMLLDRMGLTNRMEHRPNQLSGGEQQRVAIARALMNQPELILADEPTGNLDTDNSKYFFALIKELQKDLNQTFVIITHNLELAKSCDRVVEMKDGKIVNS